MFFKQSLSFFEELLLSVFLSSTPAEHLWDKIDLSDCVLPEDSILYTSKHKIRAEVPSIGMTDSLSVGLVKCSTIYPTLKTVKELSFKLKEFTHGDFKHVFESLEKNLEKICIFNEFYPHSPDICISKSLISVFSRGIPFSSSGPVFCSHYFKQVLQFVDINQIQSIVISFQFSAFTDCKDCNHKVCDTLKSLCHLLQKSPTLAYLNLTDCNLSDNAVDQIVTALSENKKSALEKINFKRNNMESIRNLPSLFSTVNIQCIIVNDTECVSYDSQSFQMTQDYQTTEKNRKVLFETFVVPSQFVKVRIVAVRGICLQYIASFIMNNTHIKELSFAHREISDYYITSVKHTCEDVDKLVHALQNHSNLQIFSCADFKLTRKCILVMELPADRQLKVCASSMCKFLHFLTEDTEFISIPGCTDAFQNCSKCSFSAETTVSALCALISKSKKLNCLGLNRCNLSEEHLEQILNLLISLLMKKDSDDPKQFFSLAGASFSLQDNFLLLTSISQFSPDYASNQLLRSLKLPSKIDAVQFDMTLNPKLSDVSNFLRFNKHLTWLGLKNFEFQHQYHCHHTDFYASLVDALVNHKEVQTSIYLEFCGNERLIARDRLLLSRKFDSNYLSHSRTEQYRCCLTMCSNTLMQFLNLLISEELLVLDISHQCYAFMECGLCRKESSYQFSKVLDSFYKVLAHSNRLRHLNLSWCELTEKMVDEISSCLSDKTQLEFIYITGSKCGITALKTFLCLMFTLKLKQLFFWNIRLQFSDKELVFTMTEYGKYYNTALSTLLSFVVELAVKINSVVIQNVEVTEIYNDQFQQLVHSECSVKSLTFDQCSVTEIFLKALLSLINTSTTLTSLYLKCFSIGPIMNEVFHSLAHNTILKIVRIKASSSEDDSCSTLVEEISLSLQTFLQMNRHVHYLGIPPCPPHLLQCLKKGLLQNRTVKTFDLSDNGRLNAEHLKSLASILREVSTLQVLNLSGCQFNDSDIEYLASSLQANNGLQCLLMDSLRFVCSPGTKSEYFGNSLQYLLIDSPRFVCSPTVNPGTKSEHFKTWKLLITSIKKNSSIHMLSVCNNRLDYTLLEDLIQHNKNIRILRFEGCGFSERQTERLTDELLSRSESQSTQTSRDPSPELN